jgi:hypothetical protein
MRPGLGWADQELAKGFATPVTPWEAVYSVLSHSANLSKPLATRPSRSRLLCHAFDGDFKAIECLEQRLQIVVDVDAEQLAKREFQANDSQESRSRWEIHQQVDVTGQTVLSTSDRPEHADVGRAALAREGKHILPARGQYLARPHLGHRGHTSMLRRHSRNDRPTAPNRRNRPSGGIAGGPRHRQSPAR